MKKELEEYECNKKKNFFLKRTVRQVYEHLVGAHHLSSAGFFLTFGYGTFGCQHRPKILFHNLAKNNSIKSDLTDKNNCRRDRSVVSVPNQTYLV